MIEYTKEQLKAAYALNLCTVSVSQIIDYEDINIMEQEYEAILNNLNLEEMPKDEALLKILKQILDTITFFRIEEGDKKFIEKEYQHRMKNAIWAAVPNIGLLIAGGNPVTTAVSLASQVGIGYMNYRRDKAENEMSRERQMWELEKTAIEQFNGLRRELFDTAWRLSAAHNFPDQLRLTERQIKQYNDILMDNDLIRKYARMDAVKDAFLAYPPFWYNFGNTANGIARGEYRISDSTRNAYREKAKEYFMQFRESSGFGLLREDEIAAACALELVDLLDLNEDRDLIYELLDEAIRTSGRANDVMQLAAIAYLKLNDREKAGALLYQLTNEQYNTVLNAQLLSSVYVAMYEEGHDEAVLGKYEILKEQVGEEFLYPWPMLDGDGAGLDVIQLEADFIKSQKKLLLEKYNAVMNEFVSKYMVAFGKLIPVIDQEGSYSDSYFMPTAEAKRERKYQVQKIFANKKLAKRYLAELDECDFIYEMVDLLNEMFDACCQLDFMDNAVQYKLSGAIKKALRENRNKVNELDMHIRENKFDHFDAVKLIDLDFYCFTGDFLDLMMDEVAKFVDERLEMLDVAFAEENLSEFCEKQGLPSPSELLVDCNALAVNEVKMPNRVFTVNMLTGEVQEPKEVDNSENIEKILDDVKYRICSNSFAEFFVKGDSRIERYFRNNRKLRSNNSLMANTIAVLDDKTDKGDFDLIFTLGGIVSVKNDSVKGIVPYSSVVFKEEYPDLVYIDGWFGNPNVNIDVLKELVIQLRKYEVNENYGINNGPLFGGRLFKK